MDAQASADSVPAHSLNLSLAYVWKYGTPKFHGSIIFPLKMAMTWVIITHFHPFSASPLSHIVTSFLPKIPVDLGGASFSRSSLMTWASRIPMRPGPNCERRWTWIKSWRTDGGFYMFLPAISNRFAPKLGGNWSQFVSWDIHNVARTKWARKLHYSSNQLEVCVSRHQSKCMKMLAASQISRIGQQQFDDVWCNFSSRCGSQGYIQIGSVCHIYWYYVQPYFLHTVQFSHPRVEF